MAVTWKVPAVGDASNWCPKSVVDSASVRDSSQGTDRLEAILEAVVDRVRGAVRKGKVTPVSLTAGSVPPEAVGHVWTLAIDRLAMGGSPELSRYTETESFKSARTAAEDWLKAVSDPKDPAGTDYPSDPDTSTSGMSRTVRVEPLADGDILTRDQCEGL
jgi:hypothetical protein